MTAFEAAYAKIFRKYGKAVLNEAKSNLRTAAYEFMT